MSRTQRIHSSLEALHSTQHAQQRSAAVARAATSSLNIKESVGFDNAMIDRLRGAIEHLLSALGSVDDQESFRAKLRRAEEALERDFAAEVSSLAAPTPRTGPGLAMWQMQKVKRYIEENIQSRIDVSDLAGLVGLSRCYFSRAFRQSFKDSPIAFIMRRRVQRAQILLMQHKLSIAQIATDCGFVDQAHLCHCFGRLVGTPPSAWRRAQKQQPAALTTSGAMCAAPC